jgi:two-component sensor histidine kinase
MNSGPTPQNTARSDEGAVRVAWSFDGDGSKPRFRLRWSESGGPPAAPPRQKGFGHTVLVQTARHALDADIALDYPASGVVWELSAPAERIFEMGAGL